MGIVRAVKFGLIASISVVFVAIGTGYLIWTQYTNTIAGQEPAWMLMLMIGRGGLTVSMLFLFALIGEYLDRELAARRRS